MAKTGAYFFIALLMVVLSSGIVYGGSVPVPNDFKIIPPDSSLPKELALFSGKWKGVWYNLQDSSGSLDAVLIVEKIEDKSAVVVYCWGDSSEWRVKNGWRRYTADINKKDGGNILSFESPSGVKFEFSLMGEKLSGTDNRWRNTITMKRVQ
jgi:hypothetical protein